MPLINRNCYRTMPVQRRLPNLVIKTRKGVVFRAQPSIAILAAAFLAAGAFPLQAALMTDNFADRPVATGTNVSFIGDNTTATLEVGEPEHGGFRQHTVWGAWTAPDNGAVTINTKGSSFDTVLAVYVGTSVNGLSPVAQNNDVQPGFTWSTVTFPTKAGETYSFAVDGVPNNVLGQGTVALDVVFSSAQQPGAEIGTDAFAKRPTLPAAVQAMGVADTRLASIELDEQQHIGFRNHTVWWRWVAPTNGSVTIDTLGSSFDTALTVYVGSTLSTLSEVAVNDNAPNVAQSRISFPTLAGQEYQIMVDGEPNNILGEGNLILNLVLTPNASPGAVPGADAFANRGLLTGTNALGVANNTFFGLDLGEPNHGSFRNHTTWWQWTAPADGLVDIKTQGSDFDTYLAVYTGTDFSVQQLIAHNDHQLNVGWSEVQFQAQGGVEYQIMVDGAPNNAAGQGNIVLSLSQALPLGDTLAIHPAVELEIPGSAGVTYQLQSSVDLVVWQNVGQPMVGAGQPIIIYEPTLDANQMFYRYRLLR
jgi:hypothetical protein